MKFKHVGIKYDCGQCDYKRAEHSKLRYHQQRKHEGVNIFFTTLCRVKNIQNLSMRVLAIPAINVGIRYTSDMDFNVIYNQTMELLVCLAINVNISRPAKENLNIILN